MIDDDDITPAWQAEIDAAQDETHLLVCGASLPRVRYGDDYPNARPRCPDCAVLHGQLHIFPCTFERCPRCRRQAMGCNCESSTLH